MVRTAALSVLLASASIVAAHADSISGIVSVAGTATYTNSSILFTSPGSVYGTSTGTFASLPDCNACVAYPINPFVFGSGFQAGLPIFHVTDNGVDVVLTIESIDPGPFLNALGNLQVSGTGILSETGYSDTAAVFGLSANLGSTGASVSFANSAEATAVTPEPSTLALFGTGLLGLYFALHRRVSGNQPSSMAEVV